jgi:HEAT repeat protein
LLASRSARPLRKLASTAALAALLVLSLGAPAVAREPSCKGKSVSGWEKALSQLNSDKRNAAAETLGQGGKQAVPVIAALVERVVSHGKDRKLDLVSGVFRALDGLGKEGAPLIPRLLELTWSEDWLLRSNAAGALGAIGLEPDRCIPVLMDMLGDPERSVRAGAAEGLGGFGERAAVAIPKLDALLLDSYDFARTRASEALGRIGPKASGSAPRMVQLLDTEDGQRYVWDDLVRVEPRGEDLRPALERFVAQLHAYRGKTRQALYLIACIGPEARGHARIPVEELAKDLKAMGPFCALALARMEPDTSKALTLYGRAVRGPLEPWEARSAARWLGQVDGDAKKVAGHLERLMRSEYASVRRVVVERLITVGLEPERRAKTLAKHLKDDDAPVRLLVVKALGDHGSAASGYVESLERRLKDDDEAVRKAAEEALAKIRAATPKDD